jgi:hypothetical protein
LTNAKTSANSSHASLLDFLRRKIFFPKKFYLSGEIAVSFSATRRGRDTLAEMPEKIVKMKNVI